MTTPPPLKERKDPMRSIVLDRGLPSRRQMAAGMGGAVIAHLLFWLLIPSDPYLTDPVDVEEAFEEFEIELAPAEEEEPEEYYTQTNPDAPENEPDETNRYGARSQQAANPDEPEEIDPDGRPASESDLDLETDQFLTGELSPPELSPPPQPQQNESQPAEPVPESVPLLSVVSQETPGEEQVPTSGELEEEEELEEEGIADFLKRETEEEPDNLFEESEGAEEPGEGESEAGSEVAMQTPALTPQQPTVSSDSVPEPRPRPRLPRLPRSPTAMSRAGVATIGKLAADANASELGEYSERMIETVSLIWDSLVDRSSNPDRDSKVILRFKLTKEGLVEDLEVVEGTTARALSIYECRTAIENGQSYGRWTDEMISQHGDHKEITFVFYYLH